MVTTAPRVQERAGTQDQLRPLTKRVPYGNTGIEVSRLCWGTGLMGHLRHHLSEEEAARILWRGLDLGVNFWDTADGYKTHAHVRRALQQVQRGEVVINTKTKAKTAADAMADVDRFLQEMNTDVLDTVLLHGIETVEELANREDALSALHRAKQTGKIRGVGISTHLGTGAIMHACAERAEIEVVLTTVNKDGLMLKHGSIGEHLPLVKRIFDAGKGICLMKTLAQGGLTKTPQMVEEAIRFNLRLPYAHSVCVGVNSIHEVEFAVAVASEEE